MLEVAAAHICTLSALEKNNHVENKQQQQEYFFKQSHLGIQGIISASVCRERSGHVTHLTPHDSTNKK